MSGLSKISAETNNSSLEIFAVETIVANVRGISNKSYYDLYELLNVYTFAELIGFFSKHYPNYDIVVVLKSLSNFSSLDLEEEREIQGFK